MHGMTAPSQYGCLLERTKPLQIVRAIGTESSSTCTRPVDILFLGTNRFVWILVKIRKTSGSPKLQVFSAFQMTYLAYMNGCQQKVNNGSDFALLVASSVGMCLVACGQVFKFMFPQCLKNYKMQIYSLNSLYLSIN